MKLFYQNEYIGKFEYKNDYIIINDFDPKNFKWLSDKISDALGEIRILYDVEKEGDLVQENEQFYIKNCSAGDYVLIKQELGNAGWDFVK